MKKASTYLPRILGLGLAASMVWAILSLPSALEQQSQAQTAAHSEVHPFHTASWTDLFAAWGQ